MTSELIADEPMPDAKKPLQSADCDGGMAMAMARQTA